MNEASVRKDLSHAKHRLFAVGAGQLAQKSLNAARNGGGNPYEEALAQGRLGEDGVFRAGQIQAKCASKYEAKPVARSSASL